MSEKQLTFEGVMRIVQGNKWIQLKDIERLEKFIQNQQATIQSLKEDNEQLKKEYKIAIDEMLTDYKKLEKENEILKKQKSVLDKFLYVRECECERLKEKNEQLRKQIQNYEQLIANSYMGEEETLDGFTGKYVIWENELQKYKNKNEMIDNG